MAFGIGRALRRAVSNPTSLLDVIPGGKTVGGKLLGKVLGEDKKGGGVDNTAALKEAEARALEAEESIRRMRERERRRTVFAGGFGPRRRVFREGESEFSPVLGGSTIGSRTLG